MSRPFRSFGNDMRSVLLATIAFGILICWALIIFGFPVGLVQIDPSRWWFVIVTGVCAGLALATARFKWMTVLAVPAALGVAAVCAATLVARCKDLEHTYPLQPYTWGMAMFVALCGLAPVCLLVAVTFIRLGMPRSCGSVLAFVLWTAPVWALVSTNVVDYLAFSSSLRRVRGLSPGELIAIADQVRDVKELCHYARGKWPVEFDRLKPSIVNVAPGYSYAPLYQRGDLYLEFAVETDEGTQSAFFFTNCDGTQKEVSLWRSKPIAPSAGPQPLVRLHEYSMHWSRDWIVLPDRVLVVGTRDDDRQSKAAVLAEAMLSSTESMKIAAIIADTKARIGGRAFMAPVDDGLAVLIRFGSSDGPAADDILLHIAWTEQAQPLFAAVCSRLPEHFRSDFARRIRIDRQESGPMPVRVLRIAEIRDEHPRLPWWCVWPDLLRPDGGYVSGRVGTSHIPDPLRYVYRD